ncbi:Nitrogen regulatory protein PII [Macleaya cordata]|uniref:Nitrogen regulatory protein PII n=1 Tax=Macleaya cordata TaxID=56857 RepID=A0A200QSZ4_MACCD|nr:Nitrogen regulatory protein PII [Macleaya cordata]
MAASTTAMAGSQVLRPLCSNLNDSPLFDSKLVCSKFKRSQASQFNVRIKHFRNASILPVIRAQNTPDYMPDSKFYKIEAILRPWRVSQVSSGLLKMGIRGVTISDVRGFGAQGGSKERHAGSEFSEDMFVAKVKLEIVVSKDQVEEVIDKIIEEARTGEIGDGKIFLVPVSDVIRVRTGERGEKGERMTGGRSDMISTANPV